jgi:hypothetical protein
MRILRAGITALLALAAEACAAPVRSDACLPAAECRCGDPEVDALGCPAECCLSADVACPNELCPCCATGSGS